MIVHSVILSRGLQDTVQGKLSNVETPCELAGDLGWIETLYRDARGVIHLHGLTKVRVWLINCLLISIFSWKLKVRCLGGSDKLWNLKEKQTLTPLKPGYWNCKINLENQQRTKKPIDATNVSTWVILFKIDILII